MELTCPRCSASLADQEFYGPCPTCRTALRATMRGQAQEAEVSRFEPEMHVTPNAVAQARGDD